MLLLSVVVVMIIITTSISVHVHIESELAIMNTLEPLIDEPFIMFWRPQKVGSSSVLSILLSYAYRYNVVQRRRGFPNSFCMKFFVCASQGNSSSVLSRKQMKLSEAYETLKATRERQIEKSRYSMSVGHHLCDLPSKVIVDEMTCAFTYNNPMNAKKAFRNRVIASMARQFKELFVVRDPLSRIISIYYFWGELFKLRSARDSLPKRKSGGRISASNRFMLASSTRVNEDINGEHIDKNRQNLLLVNQNNLKLGLPGFGGGGKAMAKGFFDYHGNESTVPPKSIAMAFATRLPLRKGMPGPSHTWTAFSDAVDDAVRVISSDRLMSIVTERLDESLVVAAHYMNWSLADVVVTVYRKALSPHPKPLDWDHDVISVLRRKLIENGEYAVYDASVKKLDSRIAQLTRSGVNVAAEVEVLKTLRKRVTTLCLSPEYLERYRRYLISQGLSQHKSNNRLRDVEDEYAKSGHIFAFNGDILNSFDVCGSCEAHAILAAHSLGFGKSVEDSPSLLQLLQRSPGHVRDSVHFAKCPKTEE